MSNKLKIVLGAATIIFVAIASYFWPSSPERILLRTSFLEKKGESGGQWLRDNLIGCGPAAIRPTILAIREHSPWNRNYADLPQVLEHFGEPAHLALLEAVDKEIDSEKRAYLIDTLLFSFGDISRFDLWLNDEKGKSNSWALNHVAGSFRFRFPEAPALEKDRQLNPDFLSWWETNSLAKQ